MLFSSLVFLFLFLPLTLAGYYIVSKQIKNYWLLLASLVFFAWGGISFTLILIGSIIFNYTIGLLIQKKIESRAGYYWLVLGVGINLLCLAIFKYSDFLISNLNKVNSFFSLPQAKQANIALPIGISFYTFHALSYLVDIYRKKSLAQRNIFDLALYISMFSQLIAGPIVRYSDVWNQLRERIHSLAKFSSGVERFIIGLGKKVLLANTFARTADLFFSSDLSNLGYVNAWLGIICYTLQIYYDFAGYSDMAIGLGRMFGFEFLENFNFPYVAKSIKEFWRRWHISLSTFFRDYVYIPLGGNQTSTKKTYLNLIIVFFLTGFWHGASWNFILWGMFHGFFMLIEKMGLERLLQKTWRPISIFYTWLVVMFGWVLFRVDYTKQAWQYWKEMFDFNFTDEQYLLLINQLNIEFFLVFSIGLLGSFGFFKYVASEVPKWIKIESKSGRCLVYTYHLTAVIMYATIFILCTLYLVAGTYNPFIYYRF